MKILPNIKYQVGTKFQFTDRNIHTDTIYKITGIGLDNYYVAGSCYPKLMFREDLRDKKIIIIK